MITTVCKISYGSQTVPQIVPAVQGDTGRAIRFEIADYTPPAGATATYFILKPSGEAIYNSATITNNSILCELTAQSLAEAGENRMQVRVLQGEDIVTSFEVILMVRTFLGDDAIESGTEMNIFDQAVAQATEDFQTNAEQIVEEVIQSIPADYTELTEEVDELNERINNDGFPSAAKEALLACFRHLVWIDEHGPNYYDDLYNALYPGDYTYTWSAESGTIPVGLEYDSVEWGANNEYLTVVNGNLFLGYADEMTLEMEVAFDPPYYTEPSIVLADRADHGARIYTRADGTLRFAGYLNGQSAGVDIPVDSTEFHLFRLQLQNGVVSLYVDGEHVADRNPYLAWYIGRPIFSSSFATPSENASRRIKSIRFTRPKTAVLEDRIRVFYDKGTSGHNIVDNTKRMLSEPISFDGAYPVRIRYDGGEEYNLRFSVKIIDDQGNIYVYDSTTDAYRPFWVETNDLITEPDNGWITNDHEFVTCKKNASTQEFEIAKWPNTNGTMRIIFADLESLDNAPAHSIGGTLYIKDRQYVLEGRNSDEFI